MWGVVGKWHGGAPTAWQVSQERGAEVLRVYTPWSGGRWGRLCVVQRALGIHRGHTAVWPPKQGMGVRKQGALVMTCRVERRRAPGDRDGEQE